MTDDVLPPPSGPPAQPPGLPATPDLTDADAEAASRRAPPWLKWFAGIGAVVAVIGITGTLIRLPYYSFSPGAALDLAPRVHVTGTKTYPDGGPLMLLFVRERARVNVWSWLQASLDPNIDLVKQDAVTGGQSPRQAARQDTCDMTLSKRAARVAALTALGYKLKTVPGIDIANFLRANTAKGIRTYPAEKVLLPCDEVVAADGHEIEHPEDLSRIVRRHRVGEEVTLRVARDGKSRTVRVPVADFEGKRVIGVGVAARFAFPFRIDVDTSNISGPSAGLAMTLAIIDDLTPGDLTGGKRVAVTGTISIDGMVGQIGAIRQKAISAKAAHAQIFIVPACGKDAACSKDLRQLKQRVGKQVDVEPVATLAQALRVLRDAGGAPVRKPSTTRAESATG
jgi:Lon-like protease